MVAAPKAAKSATEQIGSLMRLTVYLHETFLIYGRHKAEKDKKYMFALGKQVDDKISTYFSSPVTEMEKLHSFMLQLRNYRDKMRIHFSARTEETRNNLREAVKGITASWDDFFYHHPALMPDKWKKAYEQDEAHRRQQARQWMQEHDIKIVAADGFGGYKRINAQGRHLYFDDELVAKHYPYITLTQTANIPVYKKQLK